MEIWTNFVARVEAEIGRPHCISWILSDNGGVYKSTAMTAFCAHKGIQQRFCPICVQSHMAVTTLVHANLPKSAWGYAVLLAIDVINRITDSLVKNKAAGVSSKSSRLEKWKNKECLVRRKVFIHLGASPSNCFLLNFERNWIIMQHRVCILAFLLLAHDRFFLAFCSI